MLQGWISDSEKTGPPAVAPSSQSTTTTATTTNKSAGRSLILSKYISLEIVTHY
jgi:hypothetical protein